jgi:hypothetical protein
MGIWSSVDDEDEEKIWSIFDRMTEFVSGINGMTELCLFILFECLLPSDGDV